MIGGNAQKCSCLPMNIVFGMSPGMREIDNELNFTAYDKRAQPIFVRRVCPQGIAAKFGRMHALRRADHTARCVHSPMRRAYRRAVASPGAKRLPSSKERA